MSTTAGEVGRWFDNLRAVQGRMADLTHLTNKKDLYAFSKQTLALLTSDLQKQNLCSFCQTERIGTCKSGTLGDSANTFRWFLDDVMTEIRELLIARCFRIAREHFVPPYTGMFIDEFRSERVPGVCAGPANRATLTSLLFPGVAEQFYVAKPDLVGQALQDNWTFEQLCEEVVK